ncbi:MAG: hypothetical protein AB7W59_14280 [Acidimicrobiia bacterium]
MGTRQELDDRIARAVRAVLRRRRALRGRDGTPSLDTVGVQVQHGWVCISRLVDVRSCCGEELSWSDGHIRRVFGPDGGGPVGIVDRRHGCGRVPDAVEVTEQHLPGEEALEDFAVRVVDELQDALAQAQSVTRAAHRGTVIARNGQPAPGSVGRRDFNLRTLDL